MNLHFHKMQGLGNDFVVVDAREHAFNPGPEQARALADRRFGVGCDQLLVLDAPAAGSPALASYRVYNADGSHAEQCGNGVRCLGLLLAMQGETPAGEFLLDGPAGAMRMSMVGADQVRVGMGVPDFNADTIPVDTSAGHWHTQGDQSPRLQLQLGERQLELGCVSMGNPHALLLVDEIPADWQSLAHAIGSHPAFPEGCNVGFAVRHGQDQIELRVFERGAGPTLACGSGACAAMAILRRWQQVDERVRVCQKGGDLVVEWAGKSEILWMTGAASHVFQGTIRGSANAG